MAATDIDKLQEFLNVLLGLNLQPEEINAAQMAVRAMVIFVAAILMVRLGHKRFMGHNTTIDVLLGIIMGSILSRAITGNAPFFPTLAAGLALISIHWLFAALAYRWRLFNIFAMGRERCLIRDGECKTDEMRKSHIMEYDLQEALRHKGEHSDIKKIDTAYLERNGKINVIVKKAG